MATLTIPDDLYKRLQDEATRTQRPIVELLRETIERAFPTRDEEMMRLRRTLSDDLESPDIELLPLDLRPHESPIDHVALRASMPVLDPPMSVTVIDQRCDMPDLRLHR